VTVSERLVKRATAVTKSDNPLDRGLMELGVVSLVMAFPKSVMLRVNGKVRLGF
jgi:hypothetical protein